MPAPKKKIRIMRVIARLNIGGPAIQAISLSKGLPHERYHTLLVCGTVSKYEGDMSYLAEDQELRPLSIPGFGRRVSLAGDIKVFLVLRQLMKTFRPHIVHTHTAKAGTLGRLAAFSLNLCAKRRNRIRTIHTFHGHVFTGYFNAFQSLCIILIERALARLTDRIIAISPLQREDLGGKYRIVPKKKISVIPLGFNLRRFQTVDPSNESDRARMIQGSDHGVFLIGSIGRLTSIKNHALLLKALKRLKDQRMIHRFGCVFVGDGELKTSLLKEVARLGLQNTVTFMGWQTDMPPIYGAVDAVVLTSRNEGTPVALIEAMAAGRPVIATNVGGVRDLLGAVMRPDTNGYRLAERGILVPKDNSTALAHALVFLSERHKISALMTRNAREFVVEQYSEERLFADMGRVYEELTADAV
jgi:glycosyltransferase involved in cell wall biosynthesis